LKSNSTIRPPGHLWVPVAIIGSLSLSLAAGLDLLGIVDRLDEAILSLLGHGREDVFARALPEWSGWLTAVICGFAFPGVMLSVAGAWRRWVLWLTALILILGWAPVLYLAAHRPAIGVPFIVLLWAGICALVYAYRHQMPCEDGG